MATQRNTIYVCARFPPAAGCNVDPSFNRETAMRYRRSAFAGATYFFTVALNRRDQSLLVEHIDLLRQVFRSVKARHPFHVDDIVILPEHLHALWTLPVGDIAYPRRWSLIKSAFSRRLPAGEWRSGSRLAKRERGIWQRRYWEHAIRDDVDYARHVDYIHYNPVKHGHVARASDWPYSSIHRLIAAGVLESDWAWSEAAASAAWPTEGEARDEVAPSAIALNPGS